MDRGRPKEKRKKQKKDRSLNLHGVKHADADNVVREYLNWVSLPTRIITGNSILMKEIVYAVVEEYGWHAEKDVSNHGELIIYENKI